ncbi:unnamed protein product [Heligmosomoides polygyrus]|uniref:ALOG domain-containing protein n=1 Tax=Heligmosomoides polygyrus TaxID=6339 RepID=A0A183FQ10_HELPZ|nr:unnamed protein product [Heligmosomoides polygyrus]
MLCATYPLDKAMRDAISLDEDLNSLFEDTRAAVWNEHIPDLGPLSTTWVCGTIVHNDVLVAGLPVPPSLEGPAGPHAQQGSLWVRVKEHVDGLNRCKVSTFLGEHKLRSHSGAVVVTVLAREVDIAVRKALEALWIAFKNPAINRKEELMAITQELALFADLCGLDPGGASRKAAEGLTEGRTSFIHIYLHLKALKKAVTPKRKPNKRSISILARQLDDYLPYCSKTCQDSRTVARRISYVTYQQHIRDWWWWPCL